MGSKGRRRRKPKVVLPPVPDYVTYRGGGRRYWRLGGPLTAEREAEAFAARAARPPNRVGLWVLRRLGWRPKEGSGGGDAGR